jgi:hypothetical protein
MWLKGYFVWLIWHWRYGHRLHHIFIRLGLAFPTSSSLLGLHVHTCVGTLPRRELNVTKPGHFSHCVFFGMWKNSIDELGNNESDANLKICNIDRVLLVPNEEDLGVPTHTLVPCWTPKPLPPRNQCTGWYAPTNEDEFPCSCGQEDWAVKETWEGRGSTQWRCDLARGQNHIVSI